MEPGLCSGSIFICMGAKNTTKYSNIKIGDAYGSWTVVGDPFMNRYAKVPCKCKCGLEYAVDAYTLVSNKSRSCKSCSLPRLTNNNPRWKGYEDIPASWFRRFKFYSKIEFTITMKDIWNLYIKQGRVCALTRLPIDFKNEYKRGNKHSGIKCTASIDRIDSNKGYTVDNIQLVHKDVNIMKNAFNQEYFIEMCKAVSLNN